MKKQSVKTILFFSLFCCFSFFSSSQVLAQTSPSANPIDLFFPPALLIQEENVGLIDTINPDAITSWKMPLNESILQYLGDKFTTNTTQQRTQQITQIIQPASNISSNVAIRTSSDSRYITTLQVTNNTKNQIITFPDSSGEVSLLGQTITGSEIVDDTIDLLTKTTGNYVASLVSGNGLQVVADLAQAATPSISLGDLTEDWVQSGPYDIILDNAQSKLKILDSDGTNYAIFDVANLSSDVTYTLSGTTGTLLTSTNYGNFLSALGTGDLISTNNLSELTNFTTARSNLGLGTAAVQNVSTFLQTANNLSDLSNTSLARGSLGLGTIATQNVTSFLQSSSNFSDLANPTTARANLGLGTIATQSAASFIQAVNNLSDLANATTARTNLGLGTAAVQNVSAFLQTASNLSDLGSATSARSNLGLGTIATQSIGSFLQTANNLSELASASTARTNLGLGTIATQSAGNVFLTGGSLLNMTISAPLNTISGLATSNFSSANISQWTNNTGFITAATTDALTNKTIAAGSNTISGLTNSNLSGTANISNANLANSAITVLTGNSLLGAATVPLGGSLNLSLPQNIAATSSPTFAALSLTNTANQLLLGTTNIGTLSWAPSTSRTMTIPDATDTLIGRDTSDTLTNKIISAAVNTIAALTTSNFSSVNISQWTNNSGFITPSSSDTLTNKIISTVSNTISGLTTSNFSSANISQWTNNTGFITASTTDVLTNKTLTAPTINGTIATTGLTLPAFTAGGTITGSGSPTITNFGSFNGLTFTAASDGLTIAGGTTSRTVTVTGANITIGNIIKPTSGGSLTIQSNGINPLILDAGGAANVQIGTGSASAITLGADATVSASKTFSVATADKLLVGGNIIPQSVTLAVPMVASLVDQNVFIADASYQLSAVRCVYSVGASIAGTLQVTVDTGTGSPGSGTNQLSSTINLSTTVNTVYTGTLIGTPTTIVAGNKVSLDMGGTLLGLLGTCTLTLKRV